MKPKHESVQRMRRISPATGKALGETVILFATETHKDELGMNVLHRGEWKFYANLFCPPSLCVSELQTIAKRLKSLNEKAAQVTRKTRQTPR